jgi:hypothetical protein
MQDGRGMYLWLFGTIILFAVILLSNIKMLTSLHYITSFNVAASLVGVVFFILALVVCSLDYVVAFSSQSSLLFHHLFYTSLTWSYIAVALGVCYVPTILSYAVRNLYFPTTAQKLRVKAGNEMPRSPFNS